MSGFQYVVFRRSFPRCCRRSIGVFSLSLSLTVVGLSPLLSNLVVANGAPGYWLRLDWDCSEGSIDVVAIIFFEGVRNLGRVFGHSINSPHHGALAGGSHIGGDAIGEGGGGSWTLILTRPCEQSFEQ